ncbi:MAG: SpoVA/SpoVAEb family sporulation membrane protein [Oscillospiraceae bacterium]|jgi:stage V sporulation protein AC|nr:SpoVA/SpoVAEb family sporulation membrane protein [Oscillospiraceae bacterium]
MSVTVNDYAELVKERSPKSAVWKNCVSAYIWGGGICLFGEFIANLIIRFFKIEKKEALGFASIALIFIAIALTGLNVFDSIAKKAKAGTLVPITGFANSMASPALEFRSEGFVAGLGAKIFVIAGPVIVYGLSASVLYGLIIYIFKLF